MRHSPRRYKKASERASERERERESERERARERERECVCVCLCESTGADEEDGGIGHGNEALADGCDYPV